MGCVALGRTFYAQYAQGQGHIRIVTMLTKYSQYGSVSSIIAAITAG
jgi:hypothetical protein